VRGYRAQEANTAAEKRREQKMKIGIMGLEYIGWLIRLNFER